MTAQYIDQLINTAPVYLYTIKDFYRPSLDIIFFSFYN